MASGGSGSDLSAFPIGADSGDMASVLTPVKHFSSANAKMFKSCLSSGISYSQLSSGIASYSTFSSDVDAQYPLVIDWSILERIVKDDSRECIKVIDGNSVTKVYSESSGGSISYDSTDV